MSKKIFIYVLFWLIFISNQLTQRYFGIVLPLIHSYLDDVLLFPILMPFLHWLYTLFTTKKKLPIQMVILVFVYVSCTVEFIFPQLSSRFTLDYWDFLAYFIGLMAFYYIFEINFQVNSDR